MAAAAEATPPTPPQSVIGMYGLGVMGQNLALNIASKGFRISVFNRSLGKVDTCVARAQQEGAAEGWAGNLVGFKDAAAFVASLERPRRVMFLVKAGAPVDATIGLFAGLLEAGDIIIDGGNEWFKNSIRRAEALEPKGIQYIAMGVSGGEEGARHGPSLMPGGPREAFDALKPILEKVAAQTDSGPCTAYLGGPGAGNYVKMVHNGIEYGDMQLIGEAYDILKTVLKLSNDELGDIFSAWNDAELDSYLIEISAQILKKRDTDVYQGAEQLERHEGEYLLDKILDRTGNKGTGKMTCKEGADKGVGTPTINAALTMRFLSAIKEDRVAASAVLTGPTEMPGIDKDQLINDVRAALYASKICSYAQGMNLIKAASIEYGWNVDLGECARIWKGGCIIRAKFLDRIKQAYEKDADLASLLIDGDFARDIMDRQMSWRRVVTLCFACGIPCPAFAASLGYFDTYRRANLAANLVQAQRDFFGAHSFERTDKPRGQFYHCKWSAAHIGGASTVDASLKNKGEKSEST